MQFIVRKTWLGSPAGVGEQPIATQILATGCSRDQAHSLAEALASIYSRRSYDPLLDCWLVEDADAVLMTLSIEGQPLAAA